jgi:predicted aminopeptidase
MNDDELTLKGVLTIGGMGLVVFIGLVGVGMWGCPQYSVWQQGLSGQAELAKAEHNRQITIQEALAKKEAAKSLAEAEVERARGVAQANEIIGASLKDNEAYLRYLWLESLREGDNDVIYIPTEANMPILEATRLRDTE